ncbi:nuclear speckle splicing regulatory protein [Trifolium repens]|nr:nuclear speckle splicing regulatory protein [Trifolium repens]
MSKYDDDNDVDKEVKEQQKKALDEYPTTFDYDGVYDKMKEKVARPLIQDHEERDMAAALSILLKISINHFIMFIAQCMKVLDILIVSYFVIVLVKSNSRSDSLKI